MKVREIMTSDVESVTPDTDIKTVAQLMAKKDIGSVPVSQDKTILGVITDRDIVIRTIAKGQDPTMHKAKDVMSTDIKSVSSDADAHEAANIMSKYQIRRIPVVENNQLVGIVSLGDLAVENIHADEAGNALSDISQGVHH